MKTFGKPRSEIRDFQLISPILSDEVTYLMKHFLQKIHGTGLEKFLVHWTFEKWLTNHLFQYLPTVRKVWITRSICHKFSVSVKSNTTENVNKSGNLRHVPLIDRSYLTFL